MNYEKYGVYNLNKLINVVNIPYSKLIINTSE